MYMLIEHEIDLMKSDVQTIVFFIEWVIILFFKERILIKHVNVYIFFN